MTKITVLQKDSERYTFRKGNINYDPTKPEICTVTHEHMMTFGASQSTEVTTRERGNELYKRLIANGYHRFRKYKEVSWYATIENNSPYEETWTTEGIYLIPIASGVLD